MPIKKTCVNLNIKATKNRNKTFFPNSSTPTFRLEKLLKNKIEKNIVAIKIISKANMLKGSKIKDRALFSSNFDAFSEDLKISRSNEEFNNEVIAAMKIAPSNTVFNFNFTELNKSGSSAGLLRLVISNCFNSIKRLVP